MTTLRGIFPDPKPARRKNFIQENVRNLRRMEQCFHSHKEVEQLQKWQLHRHQKSFDKYQNVSARISTGQNEKKQGKNTDELGTENKIDTRVNNDLEDNQRLHRKLSAPIVNKSSSVKKPESSSANGNFKQRKREKKAPAKPAQKLHGKFSSDPNFSRKGVDGVGGHLKSTTKYKNQGIQTLDTNQIDDLYSEGVIRYPSKKCLRNNENKRNSNLKENVQREVNPSDRGDMQISENVHQNGKQNSNSSSPEPNYTSVPVKEGVDFIKLNKERTSATSRLSAHSNGHSNGAPPSNYRKGVVPKYIKDRKVAQEKEQKAKAEAFDPYCPDGHVPLPDEERKETLRMLKKNYQDCVNELNKLPIKTDTLRAQRKKIEIEKQLNKLEEGIKVFSRPKVYVKVNA